MDANNTNNETSVTTAEVNAILANTCVDICVHGSCSNGMLFFSVRINKFYNVFRRVNLLGMVSYECSFSKLVNYVSHKKIRGRFPGVSKYKLMKIKILAHQIWISVVFIHAHILVPACGKDKKRTATHRTHIDLGRHCNSPGADFCTDLSF